MLLVPVLVLVMPWCQRCGTPASDRINIAVIPKGTSHAFWQSVHAGARQAAQELNVDIAWRGPLREDDRDSQVSEVENAVARRVSGIALAPLDEVALVAPVASAQRSGVPVVIFDSGLKGGEIVSFVATDNDKGGELAGEHLAKVLGGKGKVILMRYAEGHDSTRRREDGFLRGLAPHAGIQILSSNQHVGADVEGAYKRAEALLTQYKASDGTLGVDGVFAPNESSAFAVMRVLQDNGWDKKVKFIGFDASEGLLAGLRGGAIEALIVQDPVRMGYLSVVTMVKHLRGEKVESRIDTGVHLVTRDILDRPDIKQLVQPDLSKMTRSSARGLEMRGIEKRFDATVALAGVDLAVAPGEVCGLIGENGAGKSTLMAILSGAIEPDAGEMRFDGRPYAPHGPMAARRAGVAMIYQELSLAPDLSVADNILLGMEPARFGVIQRASMNRIAADALAELGRPDIAPDRLAGDLSVADQQLVEIARAIAVGCRVLVLDEPTSTLGRRDVERLFALIARLKANGHSIVYISHFIEEVREVCDRIVVLRDGRVAGGGPSTMAVGEIVRLMVGREVTDLFPRTARQAGEAVLQVERSQPGSTPLSHCIAARFSASPAWSAPAAPNCCARSSHSIPCGRDAFASAPTRAARHRISDGGRAPAW